MRSTASATLRGSKVKLPVSYRSNVASRSAAAASKSADVGRSNLTAKALAPPPSPIRCQAAASNNVAAAAVAASASQAPGINGDVAITGATGTVGARLVRRLVARGIRVRVLTRDPASSANKLAGIPKLTFHAKKDWAKAIDGALGGVVNLAGEPIATRWSPSLKAEIRRSRLDATRAVADAIVAAKERPPVLVSSSAVGFYGTSETASFSESSPSGDDFLAKLCVEWEAEAARAAEKGKTRVVTIRTGIVLAKEGGALAKMLPVFSLFAGGPLGSGVSIFLWRVVVVFFCRRRFSNIKQPFFRPPTAALFFSTSTSKKKKIQEPNLLVDPHRRPRLTLRRGPGQPELRGGLQRHRAQPRAHGRAVQRAGRDAGAAVVAARPGVCPPGEVFLNLFFLSFRFFAFSSLSFSFFIFRCRAGVMTRNGSLSR